MQIAAMAPWQDKVVVADVLGRFWLFDPMLNTFRLLNNGVGS